MQRSFWTLALVLALAPGGSGCRRGERESSPAVEPTPTSARSAAPVAPRSAEPAPSAVLGCRDGSGTRDVAVTWTNVSSSSGCFFFSGPGKLGRDTQLGALARWEENGAQVALAFGAARFVGDGRGAPLRLQRSAVHDFNGAWRITETVVGKWVEPPALAQTLSQARCPEFEGTYAYQECNQGNAAECPGRCVINAKLTLKSPSAN
jgi:hypothetical protein